MRFLDWGLLALRCLPLAVRTSEPRHDKTNKMSVRPAKTQISMGIRPDWSEYSLCAQWVAKDPSFLHTDSEDSDQTGRVPRLIWVFAGRTFILLVLSCRGSSIDPYTDPQLIIISTPYCKIYSVVCLSELCFFHFLHLMATFFFLADTIIVSPTVLFHIILPSSVIHHTLIYSTSNLYFQTLTFNNILALSHFRIRALIHFRMYLSKT